MNRMDELAQQFEQAHQEIVALVVACPDNGWVALCEGENETFAALVNHIALGYPFEIDLLHFALENTTCPTVYDSEENLDQWHANTSSLYRDRNKRETFDLLRHNGTAACEYIQSLSEDDLKKPVTAPLIIKWYGNAPSVERVIHDFLIDHHTMHIESLRRIVVGGPNS